MQKTLICADIATVIQFYQNQHIRSIEKGDYLNLLYYLDLLGVSVFAISGALVAAEKKMDLYGVVVVSIVTAIGGGTMRDLLLNRHPIFWFVDQTILIVIILSAIGAIVYTRFRRPPLRALLLADAFGLGLFAISGAQIAESQHHGPLIIILMATITGTAGGLIRDLLCAQIPLILRKDIYATAAIAGVTIYLLMVNLGIPRPVPGITGVAFIFVFRIAAIRLRLHQADVEQNSSN